MWGFFAARAERVGAAKGPRLLAERRALLGAGATCRAMLGAPWIFPLALLLVAREDAALFAGKRFPARDAST